MSIEGIPEGWQLVRVGKVKRGEFYVDYRGAYCEYTATYESDYANYVVIRKIEKKKKRYRHFVNAEEAGSLWNAVLKVKNAVNEEEKSKYRIQVIMSDMVGIGTMLYTYLEAFEAFECIDGTPFGVEVVE